ncbi:MAG: RHS repeat domain-containing protein, partial [Pyrinomonadaceae bacterium]
LPKSTSWAGEIAGTVSRNNTTDIQVSGLSVNAGPIAFGYDADGLLTKAGDLSLTRDFQHGLLSASALGNTATALSYNGFGEIALDKATVNGDVVYEVAYTRDKLGRIIEKVETIDGNTTTTDYTYDPAGRLTEVTSNGALTAYSFDANGNRLKKTERVGAAMIAETTATYDAQDRLLQYGDTRYSYTPNGELLTKTVGTQTTTYDYDVLGNLRAVTLPEGKNIDYLIDGQNRRIGKKVNGTLVQGFLYQDQLRPIAELDGNNNLVSRFLYADKANVPAYMIKEGVTYRIVSDHLGSPRLVLNTTTGEITQRMDYDEFGNVITDTKPGLQPFGFAGGLYDRDTKLVRFGARDYDPETGRWTAKDPIMFASSGWNLYTYAVNDPVNFLDRNGLYEESAKKFKGTTEKSQTTYGDIVDFVRDPNKYNADDIRQQYNDLWGQALPDATKQAAEDHYGKNPLKKFFKWCKKLILGDKKMPDPRGPKVPEP